MKRHPLAAFFVLTFLVSWSLWFIMFAVHRGTLTVSNPDAMVQQLWKWGGFSPFFVAIVVALSVHGFNGAQRLLSRFLIWRVRFRWYVVALLMPSAISLLITAGHMMVGGDGPDFSRPRVYDLKLGGFYQQYNAWTILLPMFIQNLLVGGPLNTTPIGEESGWRGFALPYLQGRYNALVSSVILGLVWGLWRWPLYWIQGADTSITGYVWVLLGVIPGAILASWIFNNTGGSLLLVLLYNNSITITDWFLASPYGVNPALTIVAFWLFALAACWWSGATRLSRLPLHRGCYESSPNVSVPVLQNLPPDSGLVAKS